MHLHLMSEHLINNKRFPLELHIEYRISDKNSNNKLLDPYLILVFLFDFTQEDIENEFLK
jgi:carbonic anhydrase